MTNPMKPRPREENARALWSASVCDWLLVLLFFNCQDTKTEKQTVIGIPAAVGAMEASEKANPSPLASSPPPANARSRTARRTIPAANGTVLRHERHSPTATMRSLRS